MRIIANDGMDKIAAGKLELLGHTVDMTHYEGDDLHKEILQCDVFIVRSATKVRQPLIDIAQSGQLKMIIRAGVGIDNIDHVYAEEKGISVRNTPNASSTSVAELTIAHIFALARNLYISNVTMRNGQWLKKDYKGIELFGKTLGLVGFGRIARVTAKKAECLGMKVVYTRRRGIDHSYPEYTYMALDDLLATSDFVSLHLPWSKGDPAVLGADELAKMKEGSYIINTARGGAVCENALLEGLNSGHLAGAGMDVYADEPCLNQALYSHPKISLTPHIGGSTKEAQARIGDEIVDLIKEMKL